MKRLLLLSLVIGSVICVLSVQSQTPTTSAQLGTTSPPPPDPSYVYGYISLADSVSGERIDPVPGSYSFDPTIDGETNNIPLTIVFGSVATGQERAVVLMVGESDSPRSSWSRVMLNEQFRAYRYVFQLYPDGDADVPMVAHISGFRFGTIQYNPGQWRFRRVEMPLFWVFRGTGTPGWSKAASRRATPFSDLPDFMQ